MDDRYTAVDPPSGIDPRLLEDIRAGNCVALVGAGFSAAAGLPAWPDLVRAVARQLPAADQEANRATIEQLMGAGPQGYSHRELEMAAQLLFDAVGEERCRHLLRDSLRPDRLPPVMQRRLKHLLGIPQHSRRSTRPTVRSCSCTAPWCTTRRSSSRARSTVGACTRARRT